MEWKDFKTIPFLARPYSFAHDRMIHRGIDYYEQEIVENFDDTEIAETREICFMDSDTLLAREEPYLQLTWIPGYVNSLARCNQVNLDQGIIYERRNKVIKILRILGVKLQYGLNPNTYSWKLDEVTKECKLEIDQSDKSEEGRKTIKFSFATEDTDKLLSKVVDGYEVKYMLCTNAIRVHLELEIISSIPDTKLDFNNVSGTVIFDLGIDERNDGGPTTPLFDSSNENPSKKAKHDDSSTFILSSILIIPGSLRHSARVKVYLKNNASGFKVNRVLRIFPYNVSVDQHDYALGSNGHIRLRAFWGCLCFDQGDICTCEPGVFLGFNCPDEDSCSRP